MAYRDKPNLADSAADLDDMLAISAEWGEMNDGGSQQAANGGNYAEHSQNRPIIAVHAFVLFVSQFLPYV